MSKIFTFKHICNVYKRIEVLRLCFIEGVKVKVNQSLYRKLRFPDYVTLAQDGGKVVALRTGRFLPPGNSFLLEAEIMSMKNSNSSSIWNRTSDLQICSTAP